MAIFWKCCFWGWLSIVVYMSLMPNPPVPADGLLAWDKFQHAVAYSALTFFAAMAFTLFEITSAGRWVMAMTISIVTGGVIEIAQDLFTTTRSAELGDLGSDILGSLVVAIGGIGNSLRRQRCRLALRADAPKS